MFLQPWLKARLKQEGTNYLKQDNHVNLSIKLQCSVYYIDV